METRPGKQGEAGDVRVAMTRVLEAERRMLETLDNCRRRADEIVEEARAYARHVLGRTEQRIHLLHRRCEQAMDATIRAVGSEFDGRPEDDGGGPQQDLLLNTAVEHLAEVLTTAERDGSG